MLRRIASQYLHSLTSVLEYVFHFIAGARHDKGNPEGVATWGVCLPLPGAAWRWPRLYVQCVAYCDRVAWADIPCRDRRLALADAPASLPLPLCACVIHAGHGKRCRWHAVNGNWASLSRNVCGSIPWRGLTVCLRRDRARIISRRQSCGLCIVHSQPRS